MVSVALGYVWASSSSGSMAADEQANWWNVEVK